MFSFNTLQSRGNIQFPDASLQLPQFSRPESVPQIKFPFTFVSRARSKRVPLANNETAASDTIVEVVNVVMNNIEDYLPATAANGGKERWLRDKRQPQLALI